MADTKDNRLSCEELEELVPELLYGELDDARAEAVRAQLPACELDEKVAAYERMREVFRSLPDEEPPAAISAQLLHAAAKQVEGKGAGAGSFWDRLRGWISPLVMHPGLAAAASILVVGGVVGVLYLKGGDKVAQPDVPTRATAPEPRQPAPAATPPVAAAPEEAEEDGDAENLKSDFAAVGENETKSEAKPRPKRRRKAANKDKVGGLGATGKSTGLLGGDSGRSYDQGATLEDAVGPETRGEAEADEAEAPAGEAAPAPEPEPAPDDAVSEKPRAPPKKPQSQSKQPSDPHADARRLHNQARSAAERGDCAQARKLTSRIQKTDPTYYRDSVRDDRQLRKCLEEL